MRMSMHFLCGLLFVGLAFTASAETITLVADEWCPYNCEPDDDAPGFAIEAAKQIFGAAGIQVDYSLLDWDQAIEQCRAGQFNAVIGATEGDAPDFVFPQEPLSLSSSCFYVRKGDDWRFSGPASLEGRKIAVIEAYDYNSEEIANNTFGNVVRKDSLEACMEALLGRDVDTLVEDEFVLQLFEFKNHITGETVKAGCTGAEPIYVAFSPANPKSAEYARIFSEGLQAMKASGEWKPLLQKYGISP